MQGSNKRHRTDSGTQQGKKAGQPERGALTYIHAVCKETAGGGCDMVRRPAGCSVMTQTGGRRRAGRRLKTEGMCGTAGSLCCAWWLEQHCEAIIFQ